ncbi:interferon beta [Octodon degus]|uniref:Interferon beta n=1 Tax=Octodon degus TaxID=10160 RepID=A0A6P6EH57_OCTDE|nr:interferon beta [Octodon degus]
MASRCVLQIALLLSFTTSLSLSYNLLQLQQQQHSSTLACLELLKQMKGKPDYCLKDRMDFRFPEEIKQPQQFQKEKAALVIHEMLQNIFGIFRKNVPNTMWNETIVENLLVELHQQMGHLKSAILQEVLEGKTLTAEDTTAILRLKSYYWRIRRYLNAKRNSICAWTVVRVELLRNFSLIDRLTDCF